MALSRSWGDIYFRLVRIGAGNLNILSCIGLDGYQLWWPWGDPRFLQGRHPPAITL